MAKELPYFQFEPAEYLTKDISFCSLEAQGLFINICAYYWQRECNLSKEQFLRRIDKPIQFEELVKEGVIDLSDNEISIKFLDIQYFKATKQSEVNSVNGSKGGRPKKEKAELNPIESEIKPKLNPIESQTKGIREDDIKEYKIIKNNTIEERKLKFAHTLKVYISEFGKDMIIDFYNYWSEPNKTNTKFKQELEKTWDVKMRLTKWKNNNFGNKHNLKIIQDEQLTEIARLARSGQLD